MWAAQGYPAVASLAEVAAAVAASPVEAAEVVAANRAEVVEVAEANLVAADGAVVPNLAEADAVAAMPAADGYRSAAGRKNFPWGRGRTGWGRLDLPSSTNRAPQPNPHMG